MVTGSVTIISARILSESAPLPRRTSFTNPRWRYCTFCVVTSSEGCSSVNIVPSKDANVMGENTSLSSRVTTTISSLRSSCKSNSLPRYSCSPVRAIGTFLQIRNPFGVSEIFGDNFVAKYALIFRTTPFFIPLSSQTAYGSLYGLLH